MEDTYSAVAAHMGGKKQPKELSHIEVRKAKSGGHVITHHHKNHPHEEHVVSSDKEMLKHMQASIGSGAPASGDPTEAPAPVVDPAAAAPTASAAAPAAAAPVAAQ